MSTSSLIEMPVKRNNRRQQILLTACDLFLEYGYDRTSLDAVVAKAGGSKSTIYHHFTNKKKLFIACIGHICDEFVDNLNQININKDTFEAALRTLLTEMIRLIIEPRHIAFYRLIMAESAHFPEVGQEWYHRGARLSRTTILKLIQAYTPKGDAALEQQQEQLSIVLFNTLLSYLTINFMILMKDSEELPLDQLTQELIDITMQRLQQFMH